MKKIQNGDTVTINYTGKFEDGTIFDTSLTEGREPIKAKLGEGNLISGFDTVPSNIPYSNLVLPNFFFEIMERLELIVTLNGFSGGLGFNNILLFLSQSEVANMSEALKNDNGEIINILKNGEDRDVIRFNNLLSKFQVSYAKYSNGFLTTQYLIDEDVVMF